DIVDWYTAVRAARLHRLQIAFPTKRVEELVPFLTRDFIFEGELFKTGPRVGDTYKKRWFILDDRRLMYMENPLDAYPKGEIFLGEKYQGYSVKPGIPAAVKEHKFGFSLITPERTWLMGAETEEIRESWINAINQVIEKQPQPQDYSESWRNDLRNSYSYKKSRNSDRNSGSSFTGTLRKGKNFFSFTN
ncbi:centaurin-alpha 1-like protein, partial [Leptotrombidium deliense]